MTDNTEKNTIFIVDDSALSLMTVKRALENVYNVYTMPNAAKLFDLLGSTLPDLIILDYEMRYMNGPVVLMRLKNDPDTASIPTVILTVRGDIESEVRCFDLGAADFITKPFNTQRLLSRIASHINIAEQRKQLARYADNLHDITEDKTKRLIDMQNGLMWAILYLAGSVHGEDVALHAQVMQKLLEIMLQTMLATGCYANELRKWNMDFFISSALIYDLGSMNIDENVLHKPGKLTGEEYSLVKKHTIIGEAMLNQIGEKINDDSFLNHAKLFAISHHERWDGTGYPKGLSGEEIPLQGRIMAIIDTYDALTSEREYRHAYTPEEAANIIIGESGRRFDPKLIKVFCLCVSKLEKVLVTYKDKDAATAAMSHVPPEVLALTANKNDSDNK
jgi:putative two-component system response regulator